jgi:hypothetical protein
MALRLNYPTRLGRLEQKCETEKEEDILEIKCLLTTSSGGNYAFIVFSLVIPISFELETFQVVYLCAISYEQIAPYAKTDKIWQPSS